ncbi:MAG: YebC/PmpR family DNA-binding transcriptional regulator [Candidatus Eisenbacteria bacterium]|uniref:Probable transcriptional regulatory protein KJ970_10355 n=1 Tax=Eiseniibacteriota bacterium TaxID=2212470 RepID=A0A948W6A8_UNCEI|nr:YebC/PmpR family DNA-binding transcriptional regulator [Candidatus Eisenbacteria bacterium]MBU1949440.1 YebC/PmpR family DNA-binding transcriptional regulator [Candidatus Eisenbacteria bacterium]MBU2691314.1 YebC/PmpR family DNA-binding transcriptional regulator [Candidatus Eisenbacteria bacterium]
MSGHSKWSTIKRKKGKADAERGRIFTRLIREIVIAARAGGGDIDANPRLRTAVDSAKAANMPQNNIDRAVQRGTGELPGVNYEEATYEGYAPGGVAILIEVLTDNRNRTTAELRHLLTKNNGNMGEAGCVSWMFESKGLIVVEKSASDEERLLEVALDAGAEDVDLDQESVYEITTAPSDLNAVADVLRSRDIPMTSAEVIKIPTTQTTPSEKELEQCVRLRQALEDHDDVQAIHDNLDVTDEMLEKFL